jgi:hypothetical protein
LKQSISLLDITYGKEIKCNAHGLEPCGVCVTMSPVIGLYCVTPLDRLAMTSKTFVLKRTRNVVTFKYENYVEHFDVEFKDAVEIYTAIKWGAITAGLTLSHATLKQLLKEVRKLDA